MSVGPSRIRGITIASVANVIGDAAFDSNMPSISDGRRSQRCGMSRRCVCVTHILMAITPSARSSRGHVARLRSLRSVSRHRHGLAMHHTRILLTIKLTQASSQLRIWTFDFWKLHYTYNILLTHQPKFKIQAMVSKRICKQPF